MGERPKDALAAPWLVHLRGTTWSVVRAPKPSPTFWNASVYGVSCLGSGTCTAVGVVDDNQSSSDQPLILTTRQPTFAVSHVRVGADGAARFTVDVPGPGAVHALLTAWRSNLAAASDPRSLLQAAPHRFVYGRARLTALSAGVLGGMVRPGPRGIRLLSHARYRIVLRLWVSFTPRGATTRSVGYYGLHVGG